MIPEPESQVAQEAAGEAEGTRPPEAADTELQAGRAPHPRSVARLRTPRPLSLGVMETVRVALAVDMLEVEVEDDGSDPNAT